MLNLCKAIWGRGRNVFTPLISPQSNSFRYNVHGHFLKSARDLRYLSEIMDFAKTCEKTERFCYILLRFGRHRLELASGNLESFLDLSKRHERPRGHNCPACKLTLSRPAIRCVFVLRQQLAEQPADQAPKNRRKAPLFAPCLLAAGIGFERFLERHK